MNTLTLSGFTLSLIRISGHYVGTIEHSESGKVESVNGSDVRDVLYCLALWTRRFPEQLTLQEIHTQLIIKYACLVETRVIDTDRTINMKFYRPSGWYMAECKYAGKGAVIQVSPAREEALEKLEAVMTPRPYPRAKRKHVADYSFSNVLH